MLHFEVPTSQNSTILNTLQVKKSITKHYDFLNASCVHYLSQSKQQIEKYSSGWDIFKKITNPYEYIHSNVNSVRISKLRPLSRAFYKMIEMLHFFNLNEDTQRSLHSFHLAEGPGGFIEAMNFYRKLNCAKDVYDKDVYYGMTLVENSDSTIPGWSKASYFIKHTPNVKIELSKSGDGNLYTLDNLDYMYTHHRNSYSIVTGDGGFDFSSDFNKQESVATKLILCEILHGLVITRKDGHLIVKIFDLFTRCSYEIVYILSCLFKEVYICKPDTSRYGNSEKYIVCKYKHNDMTESNFKRIRSFFMQIHAFDGDFGDVSILNSEVPIHIKNYIQEVNCVFTERQLENINNTISLIMNNKRNDTVSTYNRKHIQNSIDWCKAHSIPYTDTNKLNIFT